MGMNLKVSLVLKDEYDLDVIRNILQYMYRCVLRLKKSQNNLTIFLGCPLGAKSIWHALCSVLNGMLHWISPCVYCVNILINASLLYIQKLCVEFHHGD